jgi:hypothetical protein
MKCPECLEVVMEGDPQCPYCGAHLEDDLEYGIEDEERGLTSVLSVSDEQEASAVKEVLEGDGIPVIIKSQKARPDRGDCAYGVDTWGEILVNKEDMENALATIQKYMDTQRELLIQEDVPEDEESVI